MWVYSSRALLRPRPSNRGAFNMYLRRFPQSVPRVLLVCGHGSVGPGRAGVSQEGGTIVGHSVSP